MATAAAAAAAAAAAGGTGSVSASAGARAERRAAQAAKAAALAAAAAAAAQKAAQAVAQATAKAAEMMQPRSGLSNLTEAFKSYTKDVLIDAFRKLDGKLESGSISRFKKLIKKLNTCNSVSSTISREFKIDGDARVVTMGGLQVPAQNAILNFLSDVPGELKTKFQSRYGKNILDRKVSAVNTMDDFNIDKRANGGGGGGGGGGGDVDFPFCYGLGVPVTLGVSNPTLWHSNEIEHTLPKTIFGIFTGGPPTAKFFDYLKIIFRLCGIGIEVDKIQPYIVLLWNALLLNSTKLFNQVKFSKPLFRVVKGKMILDEDLARSIYEEMFLTTNKSGGKYTSPFPVKGNQTYSQGTNEEIKKNIKKFKFAPTFKYVVKTDNIITQEDFILNLRDFVEKVNKIYGILIHDIDITQPIDNKYNTLGQLLPDIGIVFEFFKWSASGIKFNKSLLLGGANPALKRLQYAFPVTQSDQRGGAVTAETSQDYWVESGEKFWEGLVSEILRYSGELNELNEYVSVLESEPIISDLNDIGHIIDDGGGAAGAAAGGGEEIEKEYFLELLQNPESRRKHELGIEEIVDSDSGIEGHPDIVENEIWMVQLEKMFEDILDSVNTDLDNFVGFFNEITGIINSIITIINYNPQVDAPRQAGAAAAPTPAAAPAPASQDDTFPSTMVLEEYNSQDNSQDNSTMVFNESPQPSGSESAVGTTVVGTGLAMGPTVRFEPDTGAARQLFSEEEVAMKDQSAAAARGVGDMDPEISGITRNVEDTGNEGNTRVQKKRASPPPPGNPSPTEYATKTSSLLPATGRKGARGAMDEARGGSKRKTNKKSNKTNNKRKTKRKNRKTKRKPNKTKKKRKSKRKSKRNK